MPAAYAPDDARLTVAALEALHSPAGAELREELHAFPDLANIAVSQVAALRKRFSPEILHAALTLGGLQKRGRGKFPALRYVWGTPEALEQSSSMAVAAHKASRFARAGATETVDLCCGIGGDAMALAHAGRVWGVDLSAVRATCLGYNFEQLPVPAPVMIAGDVLRVLPQLPRGACFHIDPSRRQATTSGSARRSAKYADLIPGPEVIEKVSAHFAGGAIKLSSAVDFGDLPQGHLELISENGSVVQAVLWVGRFLEGLSPAARTGSIVGERSWTFTGQPGGVDLAAARPLESLSGCLHELDGSLTRADLAAAYCSAKDLVPLTVDGGYALGREQVRDVPLAALEILAAVRFSEARVAEALQRVA
ncbi:MAG TPA: hypothetical protein VHM90_19935, partial [Phycisphaerae bacterium]|nr:hypothetical protein [Phycisphaerae bacterium]